MILEVDGVEFGYNSVATISGIRFSAGTGDMVSIIGPNGVGKTTLLKCINRVHGLDSGTVLVDGSDVHGMTRKEMAKRIGYVPQRAHVSGSTVFESVLLGRKPHIDWDVSEKDLRLVGRVIRIMGLEPIADKHVDAISGGEYQMVQIARALAQQPRVMLLDEPTSNLDLCNQHRIMAVVSSVVKENGMCAVMSNHDLNLAIRYCDRFIMMKGGRVFAAGGREVITPENILQVYGMEAYVEVHRGIPLVIPR
ncbi:MAG TPA: ABC transporter ATP-binding protein [Methanomassiliicoccales archaeon]|nr:ABC transporter ATP-binding protein [Methanomassiliicoccales archaeon]